MKLLLDQGTPLRAARLLREAGWEAFHLDEVDLSAASDLRIIEYARQISAAIVTLDTDFHRLLAMERASGPSVVRIRVEGLRGPQFAELIAAMMPKLADRLTQGVAVSYHRGLWRVHDLPLGVKDDPDHPGRMR